MSADDQLGEICGNNQTIAEPTSHLQAHVAPEPTKRSLVWVGWDRNSVADWNWTVEGDRLVCHGLSLHFNPPSDSHLDLPHPSSHTAINLSTNSLCLATYHGHWDYHPIVSQIHDEYDLSAWECPIIVSLAQLETVCGWFDEGAPPNVSPHYNSLPLPFSSILKLHNQVRIIFYCTVIPSSLSCFLFHLLPTTMISPPVQRIYPNRSAEDVPEWFERKSNLLLEFISLFPSPPIHEGKSMEFLDSCWQVQTTMLIKSNIVGPNVEFGGQSNNESVNGDSTLSRSPTWWQGGMSAHRH